MTTTTKTIKPWGRDLLVIAVAALSIGTFAFVLYLSRGQARLNNETHCWVHNVLDPAFAHKGRVSTHLRSHLVDEAHLCAKIP